MNKKQREMKRQALLEQKHKATEPFIDCFDCDHIAHRSSMGGMFTHYYCGHPEAGTLELCTHEPGMSLDAIGAPAECPRRKETA